MKRIIITISIVLVILLVAPLTLTVIGFATPSQFDETYYGELGYMLDRLESAERKKIVIIGNSANAFGLRTDVMSKEFPDYDVINFGLYGAIGTKAMLDIAKPSISRGDVVILAPEQISQSLSLYFSPKEMWMAADGDFGLLGRLSADDVPGMVGNFPNYVAEKFDCLLRGEKASADGVYAQSSFLTEDGSDAGYMTYERAYNVMPGGYDANGLISYDPSIVGDGFIDYVNSYYEDVWAKGAQMFWAFSPVNSLALSDDGYTPDDFYDYLSDNLKFCVLGDPNRYVLDYEWFYDNNVHMNSAGMFVHTSLLTDDVKTALAIATPTEIELPEKPEIPARAPETGDNSDADCFTYAERENGLTITGLTEKGSSRVSLVIPSIYDGKPVVSFAANVFAGNKTLSALTVGNNVRMLYDRAFEGCTRLTRLVIPQSSPNEIGVGTALLSGADNCRVYVPRASLDIYRTHYNWGMYRDKISAY